MSLRVALEAAEVPTAGGSGWVALHGILSEVGAPKTKRWWADLLETSWRYKWH